jgi:hypothetical protein
MLLMMMQRAKLKADEGPRRLAPAGLLAQPACPVQAGTACQGRPTRWQGVQSSRARARGQQRAPVSLGITLRCPCAHHGGASRGDASLNAPVPTQMARLALLACLAAVIVASAAGAWRRAPRHQHSLVARCCVRERIPASPRRQRPAAA